LIRKKGGAVCFCELETGLGRSRDFREGSRVSGEEKHHKRLTFFVKKPGEEAACLLPSTSARARARTHPKGGGASPAACQSDGQKAPSASPTAPPKPEAFLCVGVRVEGREAGGRGFVGRWRRPNTSQGSRVRVQNKGALRSPAKEGEAKP
jgi:hypothetical protein